MSSLACLICHLPFSHTFNTWRIPGIPLWIKVIIEPGGILFNWSTTRRCVGGRFMNILRICSHVWLYSMFTWSIFIIREYRTSSSMWGLHINFSCDSNKVPVPLSQTVMGNRWLLIWKSESARGQNATRLWSMKRWTIRNLLLDYTGKSHIFFCTRELIDWNFTEGFSLTFSVTLTHKTQPPTTNAHLSNLTWQSSNVPAIFIHTLHRP